MTDTLNEKQERTFSLIIILVLLAYFAVFVIVNFAGFAYFCNADMYEDTLVARLMWEQKTLFPANYIFGNQYYVIATPVFAALFYGLTGSMNTAMALATTLMSLLIVLSLGWMIKPYIKSRSTQLAVLLAFAAAVYVPHILEADEGQLFFVMASYYACYLITFFFLAGDYVRARTDSSLRPAALAVSLVLAFCTGMQSLRQTCVSILPILAVEFISALRRLLAREKLWPKGRRMPLCRALGYTAANIGGVLLMKLLDVPNQSIYSDTSVLDGTGLNGKLWRFIAASRTVSGFECVKNHGGFFVLMFVFFTALLIAAAVILLRKVKAAPEGIGAYWWLSVMSLLAVIAASFFTAVKLRAIYLFIYYPLLALSAAIVLERAAPKLRRALLIALCVLSAGNLYFSYGEDLRGALSEEKLVSEQICDYAVDNGYELLYGNISYLTPGAAAYSDGKLIAGCWENDTIFHAIPYLNTRDIYRSTDYSRALFVFYKYEVDAAYSEAAGSGAVLTERTRIGDYVLCTSSQQLMYPTTDIIELYVSYGDVPPR